MKYFQRFVLFLLLLAFPLSADAAPHKTAAVTSGDNSSGLTLILDCPNESHISGIAKAGANATINFDVSNDRTTWHTHTVLLAVASGTALIDVEVGVVFVRITSATTAVALDYDLGCKQ